jgi:hypothetical protein
MRKHPTVIALTLFAAAAAACGESYDYIPTSPTTPTTPSAAIVGSGRFVTESRAVAGFNAVAVAAGGRAIVTQGAADSLQITAEDNILPFIESTVAAGRLSLRINGQGNSISSHGVTYRITVRDIRELIGSAGSTIEAAAIETEQLVVNLSAGSTFSGTGLARRFDLSLSAGSRVDAPALTSRDAVATLSAGSTALVRVTDSLSVTASSGSVFEYFGTPTVNAETSSASCVRRAGP